MRRFVAPAGDIDHQIGERFACLAGQLIGAHQSRGGDRKWGALGAGNDVDFFDGFVANAAFGHVDDTFERQVVGRLVYDPQIGDGIANFGAFVKAKTADYPIVNADLYEAVFEFTSLMLRAYKYSHAVEALAFILQRFNFFADRGAFTRDAQGRYRVDMAKMRAAVDELSGVLLNAAMYAILRTTAIVNRNQGSDWGWDGPAAFLGMMLYLLGPGLLWWFWRGRAGLGALVRGQALMVCVAVVPLSCFAWVSLRKDIGLHWVMAFYPFLFLMAAWCGEPERRLSLAKVMAAFLAVHLIAVLVLALTPLF